MLRHALFAAALLVQPLCASASVHWLCGLSSDLTRLECVAENDVTAAPVLEVTATAAVVNGTAFPLDSRRSYTVEMWSPPSEIAFVEHLARATLCHRTAQCQVTVSAPELTAALAVAAQRAPARRRRI